MANLHVWQIQAVRDVLVILAIIGLVWLGYAMRAVTVPLLIALALAYLFEPLVSHLTRKHNLSRPMVVGGLLTTVGLIILLALALIIPLVIGQTVRFVSDARQGRFQTTLLQLQEYVPADLRDEYESSIRWMMPGADRRPVKVNQADDAARDEASVNGDLATRAVTETDQRALDDERVRAIVREELLLANQIDGAGNAGVGGAGSLLNWARSGAQAVFNLLGSIIAVGLLAFLIPFYFFFFSVSYPAIVRFGRSLVPEANRARTLELIAKMDRAVAGFVRGRIVIALIMGVMLAIGWWVCGVPYSIPLGLLIGAFSIVPYLGGVGIPLAVGLLAIEQLNIPPEARMSWLWIIGGPIIVFSIVQVVETYLLTPMIAGKATNLDPVTILVAVLAGGSVGGVYGMILAIPVAACLKIIVTDVLLPRVRAWTKGEIEDPLPISRQ